MLFLSNYLFLNNRTSSTSNNADKGASATTTSVQLAASGKDSTYWAKGTGFGFGSTVSSWDIEKAMKQKKREEKDMVIILQVTFCFLLLFFFYIF